MRRTWIKLFCDQWLRGSIRKEAIETRGIFADLLAMAGDSAFGDDGMIQLAEEVGFTDQALSGILNVPVKTWLSAKERLSNHPDPKENRIEVILLSQGYGLRIINWTAYQSEYQRQKKYRVSKKESPPQTPKERQIEGEGEGEGEQIVTQVTTKVTKKVTEKEKGNPETIDFSRLPFEIQKELSHINRRLENLKMNIKKAENQAKQDYYEREIRIAEKEKQKIVKSLRVQ